MDLTAMFAPPDIMSAKKALCVQPHPDDIEIGMGGTVAVLAQRGCEIHYLTITDGSLGLTDTDMTHEQLAALRVTELESSGRLLGASEFFNLAHPDGSLGDVPSFAAEVAEIIRAGKYDAVFCPDPFLPYEAHYDHITTGRAVAQAFISSGLVSYPRGTKTAPWQPDAIGFYFTANVNCVVDITHTNELKFEAVRCHKSQFKPEELEMLTAYFTARGKQLAQGKGFDIGEGFKALRGLHLHCVAEAVDI